MSARLLGILSLLVTPLACNGGAPGPAVAPASSSSSPPISSAPSAKGLPMPSAFATSSSGARVPSDAGGASVDGATGWKDPRVGDELAQHCDFVPEKAVGVAPPSPWDIPPDPFHCEAGFQVGQAPHPCKAGRRECQHPHAETCRTCSAACVSTCGTCGKGCGATDAACRRTCGQSAAACLAGCYASLRTKVDEQCMAPLEKCMKAVPTKAHGGSP